MDRQRKVRMTALMATGVVAGMTGLAFAAVPLYDAFCRATGFGGTPAVASETTTEIGERLITVRFNADTQSQLPWRFQPVERAVTVRVGESGLAFYRAENVSDQPLVGTATYNVTPLKAGAYFTKVDCFCFTEQYLAAGATADLPVSFYVDPAIADDPDTAEITTITLSYMFFNAGDEAQDRYQAAALDVDGN